MNNAINNTVTHSYTFFSGWKNPIFRLNITVFPQTPWCLMLLSRAVSETQRQKSRKKNVGPAGYQWSLIVIK